MTNESTVRRVLKRHYRKSFNTKKKQSFGHHSIKTELPTPYPKVLAPENVKITKSPDLGLYSPHVTDHRARNRA